MALLPTNVEAFGEGLEQSSTDVTLYLALRESARQRLFAAAGWLREQMLTLVEQYAQGDHHRHFGARAGGQPAGSEQHGGHHQHPRRWAVRAAEDAGSAGDVGTTGDHAGIGRGLGGRGRQPGHHEVDAVGDRAGRDRTARAGDGWTGRGDLRHLVGLELRPRRMRDAANLWAAVRAARGVEGRDAIWSHPDLLPSSADLDDPLGFVAGESKANESDASFDRALAELLDEDNPRPRRFGTR